MPISFPPFPVRNQLYYYNYETWQYNGNWWVKLEPDVNWAWNDGNGVGVFDVKTGTTLSFKSLVAGSGVSLSSNTEEILITSTGGSGGTTNEAFTAGTYSITAGTITFTNATGGTSSVGVWNYVTGGTYSSGTTTFTNNTGGTFNVTGFLSNATTAVTLSSNVLSVTLSGGTPTTTTINAVTGGTYSNGTITLSGTGSVNGNTITGFPTSLTGAYLPLSGGTVTGGTIFQSGLTANTISATTYQNLGINGIIGGSFDGGGSVITVGSKVYIICPFAGTITGWNIVSNGVSPTCTIDIWKIPTGTSLPTVLNTITGIKPALTTGNAIRSTTLTGWITSVSAGDIFCINIDAVTISTLLNFEIEILKS